MSSCSCGSGYDREPDPCAVPAPISPVARRELELLVVRDSQAGAGSRERCDGCAELVGNYHRDECPTYVAAVQALGR